MVATCNLHLHQRNHWVRTKINKCNFSKECGGALSEPFPVNSDFTNLPNKSVTFFIWFILQKVWVKQFECIINLHEQYKTEKKWKRTRGPMWVIFFFFKQNHLEKSFCTGYCQNIIPQHGKNYHNLQTSQFRAFSIIPESSSSLTFGF